MFIFLSNSHFFKILLSLYCWGDSLDYIVTFLLHIRFDLDFVMKMSWTLTILFSEFSFQKPGCYRQNQNAILVFVFITLYKPKFSCFPKYTSPPLLRSTLALFWWSPVISKPCWHSFNDRLHASFMPAEVFSSADTHNFPKDI